MKERERGWGATETGVRVDFNEVSQRMSMLMWANWSTEAQVLLLLLHKTS